MTPKRIYCNTCRSHTNHLSHGSHRSLDEDEDYTEEVVYTLWTCAGCEAGTLEKETSIKVVGLEPHNETEYSPKRSANTRQRKFFRRLPKQLRAIYKETVSSFNEQLPILTAAGLRALVEGICQDKGIKGRRLEEKIDGLQAVLPHNIVEHLHGFRFMGNDALHELGAPDRKTLLLAIEVSEDLLNFLYELDYKASKLPKKRKMKKEPRA